MLSPYRKENAFADHKMYSSLDHQIMDEFNLAIASSKSAFDLDQIDYSIIKNLTPECLSMLLEIYNGIF